MKMILGVIVLFLLLSTGIGVFWFTQAQRVQTDIKAASSTKVLGTLISDCNFLFSPSCPPLITGVGQEPAVRSQVSSYLVKASSVSFRKAIEQIPAGTYKGLLPGTTFASGNLDTATMIANTSLSTGVSHKLLLTLLALSSPQVLAGLPPASFSQELLVIAQELSKDYETQNTSPTTGIRVGKSDYLVETNLNTASRALYVYLADHTESTTEFEQIIGYYNKTSPKTFWNVWRKAVGDLPF